MKGINTMASVKTSRKQWLEWMLMIVEPVLSNLSQQNLKKNMPVEAMEGCKDERSKYTHLEAFARSLAGIAPWLEHKHIDSSEEALRLKFAELARKSIKAATDTSSADYMNFSIGDQPLVDTAFLAHAIVRAPKELYELLDENCKQHLIRALKASRIIQPYYNNWLLFSAMVETALYIMGCNFDIMRIDYALRQHFLWYKGDGVFGDGQEYSFDYYNSFVIQPMLYDILNTVGHLNDDWKVYRDQISCISARYAAIQERMISPEGTYPPLGRSLAYRFGSFQHLAQMVLVENLPGELSYSQVRCALTKVISRSISEKGTFDEDGWLKIGIIGSQTSIGEKYISTGSLYLCATVFLVMGLDENHKFWTSLEQPWTSMKIWYGQDVMIDKSI